MENQVNLFTWYIPKGDKMKRLKQVLAVVCPIDEELTRIGACRACKAFVKLDRLHWNWVDCRYDEFLENDPDNPFLVSTKVGNGEP